MLGSTGGDSATTDPPSAGGDAPPRAGPGTAWRRRLLAPDRYGLVLLLILTCLLVIGLAGLVPEGRLLVLLLLGGTLLFTLHTSQVPHRVQRRARLLVGGAVGLSMLALASGRLAIAEGMATVVAALLVLSIPPAIARRLLRRPVIDAATVLGALSVYLLVGLLFTLLYGLTVLLGQGPFFANVDAPDGTDYLYFSFVTLTTVGYGDLVARGSLGRMLAVTEALLGQLYLVTVVALLVGNIGRPRRASGEPRAGAEERRGDAPPGTER